MSKNVLKKMEGNDVNFFVMRSFVYPIFETDRKKPEYHIFYIKKNSNPDAYYRGYMNLKIRRMNKKEILYFKNNVSSYYEDFKNEDGTVFNLKDKPFDKTQCPLYKQFVLNLYS